MNSLILVGAQIFLFSYGVSGFEFELKHQLSHSENIMKRIEVHLIKKDWYPRDFDPPDYDRVVDEWDGPPSQAATILANHVLPGYESEFFLLQDAGKIFDERYGYNSSLSSIMVIQTTFSFSDGFFSKNTIKVLAMRNMVKNYNVFNLRFPPLQPSIKLTLLENYFGFAGNYPIVGEAIASFFIDALNRKVITTDQINLIGYSYSAQLSGYIGRAIKKRTKKSIKSILALDPHSAGVLSVGVTHVNSRDAQTVHVIHTNSIMYGSNRFRGTADFIVNNGNFQPGCIFESDKEAILCCSHVRAPTFMWYMILYKSKFEARSCPFYWKFCWGLCSRHPTMTIAYPLDKRARGIYYIDTTSEYPFGRGLAGATSCRSDEKDVKSPSTSNKQQVEEYTINNGSGRRSRTF